MHIWNYTSPYTYMHATLHACVDAWTGRKNTMSHDCQVKTTYNAIPPCDLHLTKIQLCSHYCKLQT